MSRILITGSNGFIASNLVYHLKNTQHEILTFSRGSSLDELEELINDAEIIFHLAGINRAEKEEVFFKGNTSLTSKIIEALQKAKSPKKVIFSSSIQAGNSNPYGISKLESEQLFEKLSINKNLVVVIDRLNNIFGKWSKPNYNSVVATFCYNITRGISCKIINPNQVLKLSYIDDLIDYFINQINAGVSKSMAFDIPTYEITVNEIYKKLLIFNDNDVTIEAGIGFDRALYATFLSFKESSNFSKKLTVHRDHRGDFVEFIKSNSAGQFSYFTAYPGVIRGQHYHHTKNEKFLVIAGEAIFRMQNILTKERISINLSSSNPQVVESIPGWAHEIENTGESLLITMLWTNEIFDESKPDTIKYEEGIE